MNSLENDISREQDTRHHNIPVFTDRLVMDEKVSPEISQLIIDERSLPKEVSMDTTLHPKITDTCGLACSFCHNEGTPVASAFSRGGPAHIDRSGRVSIFAASNGVNFVPGEMHADDNFRSSITTLGQALGLDEMHMTGGEPTRNSQLIDLIMIANEQGYRVKLTSNGETGGMKMAEYAAAGLESVNFSIFGSTPEEIAEIQATRFQNASLAERKLSALKSAITLALDNGIDVKGNVVMPDTTYEEKIIKILETFDDRLSLRILNDLRSGQESYLAIYGILARLRAVPIKSTVFAGSSSTKTDYVLPGGREVIFKQIRRARLNTICDSCVYDNDVDCHEGFYGARLYVDEKQEYRVGVCIQRMDLTLGLEKFLTSNLPRVIREYKQREYDTLLGKEAV